MLSACVVDFRDTLYGEIVKKISLIYDKMNYVLIVLCVNHKSLYTYMEKIRRAVRCR